mgnify:CR=1 FL=1
MRSGITRRWLRGSLLITVLLVLLVEVMFLYSATRSYYNGVQQTMYRRFSSITGQLKMYTGETSQKTAASRSVALRRMVEQFSDKDKYEFMLLDSYGGVIASSSGTDAEGIVTRTDFEQAQDAVDGQGIAIYRTQSGEMVMAACCLVPYAAEDVAAMRLVTSLTLVEEQLKRTVVVALIMGAAVLAFTMWRSGTIDQLLNFRQELYTWTPETSQSQTEEPAQLGKPVEDGRPSAQPEILGKPMDDDKPKQQASLAKALNDLLFGAGGPAAEKYKNSPLADQTK